MELYFSTIRALLFVKFQSSCYEDLRREIFIYIATFFPFFDNFDNDQIDVIIQRNHSQAFVLQWNGKKEREKKKNLIIEQKVSDKKKSGISELNTPMTLAICIHSPANGVVTTWPRHTRE